MSDTIELLRSIITTSNTCNTQLITYIKELSNNIEHLVTNTQNELLTKISNDYNINYKELQRKYIGKSKKVRKNIDDIISGNDEKSMNDIVEQNNRTEIIFKKVNVENNTYLLNVGTNELYDVNNNIIGKKVGDKYMFKKR